MISSKMIVVAILIYIHAQQFIHNFISVSWFQWWQFCGKHYEDKFADYSENIQRIKGVGHGGLSLLTGTMLYRRGSIFIYTNAYVNCFPPLV